jgi:precorrin-2 dehydrogenase/sirohydrochlorin ferrochelatase
MLPLVLDLSRLPLILIGDGAKAERRLALLDAADAVDLTVYAERPSSSLVLAAGCRLVRRLPSAQEVAAARAVFISDKSAPYCRDLAATARAAGALVHVEDEPALCDVHAPAVLRRGELTIAVSTGGRAPGLAAQLKRWLGTLFGPEWHDRIDELAALRQGWRASSADADTVTRRTEAWLSRLPPPPLTGRMPAAEGFGQLGGYARSSARVGSNLSSALLSAFIVPDAAVSDDIAQSRRAEQPAATPLPAALARRRPPPHGGRSKRGSRSASPQNANWRRSG